MFRFLRAGYGPFTDDEVDELENYCLALGIRGYKNWQQRWVRKGADVTEDELEHLNHLRVKLVELVDGLLFVLRQRKKTVRDITEALYRFLEEQELQQELKRQEDAFTEEGELFGALKDVMETGANDVYIIEMTDGKEVLVPAIKQCI